MFVMDILSKLRTLSSYRILKTTQLYGPGIEVVVLLLLFSLLTYTVKKLKISTLDGAETTHNNMKVRLSLGLPLILEVKT